MERSLQNVYRDLERLLELTVSVNRKLHADELDKLEKDLGERQALLECLEWEASRAAAALEPRSKSSEHKQFTARLENLIESIKHTDKENMEVIQVKLKSLTSSIIQIKKEREAVNELRAQCKSHKKQIIDFIH